MVPLIATDFNDNDVHVYTGCYIILCLRLLLRKQLRMNMHFCYTKPFTLKEINS